MITDIAKQVERWGEHFSELYSRENVVVASALDAIEHLLIMEELDAIPTLGELGKAIDSLTCAKAPGNDGIPQTWSGTARPPFCSLYTTPFPSSRVKVVVERVYPEFQYGFRAERSTEDMILSFRQL